MNSVEVYCRRYGADTDSYDRDSTANGIEIEQALDQVRSRASGTQALTH